MSAVAPMLSVVERDAWLRLGADVQDVTVRVLRRHLIGPRVVGGRFANFCAAGPVLLMERLDILGADPHPRAGELPSLLAEVDPEPVSQDQGEGGVAGD